MPHHLWRIKGMPTNKSEAAIFSLVSNVRPDPCDSCHRKRKRRMADLPGRRTQMATAFNTLARQKQQLID